MRIAMFSDIHNETREAGGFNPVLPDADLCIVAGDLDEPISRSIEMLQDTIGEHMECIYVAGNHDHWNHVYRDNIREAYKMADRCPNVHFLENELVIIDGVRFIGATLWTDYRFKGLEPVFAKQLAERDIKDYRFIKTNEQPTRLIRADDLEAEHYRSRRFIQDALKVPFDGHSIVVTHHGPHPASNFHWHDSDMLSAAYVSDLSEIIFKGSPSLWVHGHTHHSFDYQVFDTRIICNPMGYQDAPNPEFNPMLVVDTDTLNRPQRPLSYEELFAAVES